MKNFWRKNEFGKENKKKEMSSIKKEEKII